eukprot:15141975-Alexandrium_andersonii.AAC.2
MQYQCGLAYDGKCSADQQGLGVVAFDIAASGAFRLSEFRIIAQLPASFPPSPSASAETTCACSLVASRSR